MIFYHVSRPHHSLGPHAPNLVRAAATTDAEQDFLITLAQSWASRLKPGEPLPTPDQLRARARSGGTPSPSVYVPLALHAEIPTALLISEHELQVTHDMRALNRARFRRDFTPHYHGNTMARLRFSTPGISNPLLRHAVLQFLRSCPLNMFPDLGLASTFARAAPPDPTVLTPDGTRYDPTTGEIVD